MAQLVGDTRLNPVDPVGSFQRGRQNALTIQGQEQNLALQPKRNALADLKLQGAQFSNERAQVGAARQDKEAGLSDKLTQSKLVNQSARAVLSLPKEQRPNAITALNKKFEGFLPPANPNATEEELQQAVKVTGEFIQQAPQTTGERNFALETEGFTPEEVDRKRRIDAGFEGRAVGNAAQTIAAAGTAEEVGDSEAVISERKKFGELTGSSRAKTIDKGFESIQKIDKNIANMELAITAIDEGASTGAIESRFFPSFRESTLKLEALQKELALDVIGAVTFGALSKGELDLAREVALPTNLEPAALRQKLIDRTAAQKKLRGYYQEQIDFLDEGGSIAGFMRSKRRQGGGSPEVDKAAQGGREGGELMTDAQGNKAMVFPDGTFEEVQ
jgi:hypothetical protein